MQTQCPVCKEIFDTPDEYIGRSIKCAKCKHPFLASTKNIIEEVQPDIIRCPKCNSSQIAGVKKGFSGGKSIVGGFLLGPLGLFAGLHGSKRIVVSCLNCGHQWQP